MITVSVLQDKDATGAAKCMSDAFDGTTFNNWLNDPSDPTIIIRQTLAFRLGARQGSEQQSVALDESGTVCGLISFVIRGPDGNNEGGSVLGKLEAILLDWEIRLRNLPILWAHRQSTRTSRDRFKQAMTHAGEKEKVNMDNQGHSRFVHIHLLTVSPGYQGRGIGQKLLHFAKQVSETENIPIYLESSAVGYPFYMREGFIDLKNSMDVWDEGVQVWSAAAIMWSPSSRETTTGGHDSQNER